MKKAILSLTAIFMLAFVSTTYAQDDLYYNPSDDYFQEEQATQVTPPAAQERTATRAATNDCNYCYTSRVRRFRNNYQGFNYYDPCYTDGYYYNTANAGQNIYLTYGSPYSYVNNISRPAGWSVWNSPYSYGAYNPYNNNVFASNYGGYGTYNGYGNNYGYANNNAYCPPNAYGGNSGSYYAGSTPGTTTNTAPRGVRTSNTSNPSTNTRSGSGRSGSNPDDGRVAPTRNNTTSSSTTTTATRGTRNTPSTTTSTRSTRSTGKPSTTTRSNKKSRFGSAIQNLGNKKRSSTRSSSSSRSNSSYKPSRSSRSNSSYKPSRSSRSPKSSSSRSSRGGRGGK